MSTEETLETEHEAESSDEGLGDRDELEVLPSDEGAGKKTLGVERWIQLAFVAAALLLMWLADHLISAVWYIFADPQEWLVTFGAVASGIVGAIILYRTPSVYGLVHDVTEEMARVSWPTRKETSSSTVVVVITSLIAALMLFLFDSVWSAVTDLVYKV
jgi:preprotein translocase subunit SecE